MPTHKSIPRGVRGQQEVIRVCAMGLTVLSLGLLLPLSASAQMTLINQAREVDGAAEIFDDNTGDSVGWVDYLSSADMLPFDETIFAGASESYGYTDSEVSQSSFLGPTQLELYSYVYTDAELFDSGYDATARSASNFSVDFSVAQATDWNLDGTIEAHANGQVDISLVDSFGNHILSQSWYEMFPPLLVADSGTLAPGTYTLTINTSCFDTMGEAGFYAASEATVGLTFSTAGGGTSPVGNTLAHGRYLTAGPNPMQNNTSIAFAGTPGQGVDLDVFDIRGRLVRRLLNGGAAQGLVAWDGRNSAGQSVPQGIYFLRMRDGRDVLQRKVTVVR